jgi:sRNA-binding protein
LLNRVPTDTRYLGLRRQGERMSRGDIQRSIAELAERFPSTFTAEKSLPHRPLKVGIAEDLVAAGIICKTTLGRILRSYCQRPLYLVALTEGSPRYGLDGSQVGMVSADEAASARDRLAAMDANRAEQAAEAEQCRDVLALRVKPGHPQKPSAAVAMSQSAPTPASVVPTSTARGSAGGDGLRQLREAGRLRRNPQTA